MGYLDNDTIIVDAILTKRGRELIAKGDGSFKITQFAISDDEVDYDLYDNTHSSGSAYYGEKIENMPLMEAFPDENQIMKYKLITAARGVQKIPIVQIGSPSISLKAGSSITLNPSTLNYIGTSVDDVEPSGYSITISDARLLSKFGSNYIDSSKRSGEYVEEDELHNISGGLSSKTLIGTSFNLTATTVGFGIDNNPLNGNLYVVGRDSGARISVPITINP